MINQFEGRYEAEDNVCPANLASEGHLLMHGEPSARGPRTWAGLTLILAVSPSCPAALPILPNSQLPNQNRAVAETAWTIVKPTQVHKQMTLAVLKRVELAVRNGAATL